MFGIYMKPLGIDYNRYIYLGAFGNIKNVEEEFKKRLFAIDQDDPYKLHIYQKYNTKYYEIIVKDFYTDEEEYSKIYDIENDKFIDRVEY